MNLPLLLADFDWSQVLYFLIPLVYVAAQFLGGDKDKKGKPGTDGKPATNDPQDQLSRVREEIRRKVAERQEQMRRAMTGEGERADEQKAPARVPGGYDPTLPEWAQRRDTRTVSELEERKPAPVESAPPPVPVQAPPLVPQENPLDRQLREQRARLAKARSVREAAFAEARKLAQNKPVRGGGRSIFPVGSTRGQVFAALGSPNAARTAIVLSEVLGPPRSMRGLEERG